MKMSHGGGKELAAKLNMLPSEVQRAVGIEALTRSAEPIRSRMQSLAPREPGAPDLADNIRVSPASRTADLAGTGGSERLDAQEIAVAIGPTRGFFYGYFQEFGTVSHGAQPFARPAFDGEVERSLGLIGQEYWNAIKRVTSDVSQSGGRLL